MIWTIEPREFRRAADLAPLPRYAYTVNAVREHGELCCLRSDAGWVVGVDPDSDPVFPVWPHPDFAVVEATGDWADAYVEMVSLDVWKFSITPMLEAERFAVGVFPADGHWVHVWPAKFLEHIEGIRRKRYSLPRAKRAR